MVNRSSIKIDSLLAFIATVAVASAQEGWGGQANAYLPAANMPAWPYNAANFGYAQPNAYRPMMRGKAMAARVYNDDYASYESEPTVYSADIDSSTELEYSNNGYNNNVYNSYEAQPTVEHPYTPYTKYEAVESTDTHTRCPIIGPVTVTKTETCYVTLPPLPPLPPVTVTVTSTTTSTGAGGSTATTTVTEPTTEFDTTTQTVTNTITWTVAPTSDTTMYNTSTTNTSDTTSTGYSSALGYDTELPTPVYSSVAPGSEYLTLEPSATSSYGSESDSTIFLTTTRTSTSTSTEFIDTTSEVTVTWPLNNGAQFATDIAKKHSKPNHRANIVLLDSASTHFAPVIPEHLLIKPAKAAVPNQNVQWWIPYVDPKARANLRMSTEEKIMGAEGVKQEAVRGMGEKSSEVRRNAEVPVNKSPQELMDNIGFRIRHGAGRNNMRRYAY
ncbi:hypothetical protein BX661DRAFT_184384 [Kickxella alabastrina]|uniref:uncharacterized protein n=1 Tax=Kickxella alabastrina TaxID=61397 RepID=UPI00221F90AF|nr:uncharacterized protein BX661DRAFT_184384 [Kickxella alabastrina]KAI7825910.1 hypothetical protein BX661DRAFT_184384 [Kickxella alabastrina]KAJ1947239.1 hypothetical protein GGF37_000541 [Kickxella alabastrina]